LALFAVVVFLIAFKIELAKAKTVMSYQSSKIKKTSLRVEKISDEIYSIKGEVKSLNDRFQILIDLQ